MPSMQMDALTVAATTDALTAMIAGARVETVYQPTPQALALQCWAGAGGPGNRWLLISAHPQLARVQLLREKPRKLASEPPTFVMLLRKHLEGARLVALRQPPWERILELGFARGPRGEDDAPAAPQVWLVAEMMGRLSNVVLRDAEGMILGALHLVDASVNRYRTIAPHVPYRYPPPQTRRIADTVVPRLDGVLVNAEELSAAAASVLATDTRESDAGRETSRRGRRKSSAAPTVAALVTSHVQGFGPDLGREIAARALHDPAAPLRTDLPWPRIAAATRELAALMTARTWQPSLVYPADGGAGVSARPTAYAVYDPQQYRLAGLRIEAVDSVLAMLERAYRGAEWHAAVDVAKADLRHLLHTLHERVTRKDAALREELRALEEADQLREEADILLAFQSEITPNLKAVTLDNPFAASDDGARAGQQITLTLDPALDAVGNANKRYARYHKLQRAASQIPTQIAANDLERARIEQLQTDLELAESLPEIAHVREEAAEAGYLHGGRGHTNANMRGKGAKVSGKTKNAAKGKGGKPGKGSHASQKPRQEGGAPIRRDSTDGFILWVGKNSRQNEQVTFHLATSNDTWLHARGVPGAHVIIKNGGRPVPPATLEEAAALAAYYSQAREAGSVPVDYTEQRYVRHMKGGGPGMVVYEREHTLHADPRATEAAREGAEV